jgi:hypothetical protein
VYKAVAKYAQEFRSDQNKLLGSMVVTGVLGLPVFFPFGVPSLLLAGAVAGSAIRWQELGAMLDRLKPEYMALKNSVLLEQFIKWLSGQLRSRQQQSVDNGIFQPDELTTKNLIAAYEHTIGAVENGEHLDNNASDPILALFVAKLRQHTNQVPEWVIIAFRQLEQAETQRAADLARTNQYMFGNLEERYPERFNQQVGQNTRSCAVDVPTQPMEGEQRQGESLGGVISQPQLPPHPETNQPDKITTTAAAPVLTHLLQMPRRERAIAVLNRLSSADGFDLSRCIADQITCICGNQRGGKGTLMAILAILSSAIDESTKVHYFTAGDDIYPFKCERLVCRLTYPALDGEKADRKVALELYGYLKEMDNSTIGSYQNIILVIDEAVALSDYLTPEQKQWMIRFLLTRAKKKGAQIFIVLHGINLTSWVGSGNTSGFSSTFKTGATFIGCEATSKKIAPLRAISVATGRYFLADPDDFSKSLEAGHLGVVPGWLKTEINPATGQPDPARTLLKFFPELKSSGQLVTKIVEVADSHPEMDKQAWDRLILESTDDQINELIEQHRTKPENIKAQANDFLSTIDERIDYAVELITEYLQEKKLESDTARNIFNFKSKLKKVAKSLTEFNDLLEVAAEMKKISYLVEGKSNRVGLLNDS